MPLAAGTRIGPYEIVAPLGAGGMGEVWRAKDERLGREVAIKALPEAFANDPERLARFKREARVLASLNHPNIAAIYGLEQGEAGPCLVLELVEGESLAERRARGPLPLREVLDIGSQMAAAIEAAHERGVVHRDLKPANVMIASSRAVKVLDFGLAKEASREDATTMVGPATVAGHVLGTSGYMSPEQASGQSVDRRTDVWAFGCVLFELLTGRRAFPGGTSRDILSAVLTGEPEWDALGAHVPTRLRDVVRRCLTKETEDRPRDMGDVRRELVMIERELSSPSRPASATGVPSLAVLYFENSARDPESEYFCGGITEDILTDLSKLGGLRVVSKYAVARYRGQDVNHAQVGTDLGVNAVLEGSVRRSGDRVRITAQLVNAADGFHLWAERYDRTLDDVFAVQEEIASSIAQALKVALAPKEAAQLVHGRPDDARAYDLYLKGRQLYESRESFREALALFEQAITIDPGYGLAYAGIADAHGQLVQWGDEGKEEHLRLGLAAARTAIALSPEMPEGYKALGLILQFSGDRAGWRAALLKGLEVDPRSTQILGNLGVESYGRGDLAGAERYFRRAVDSDPHSAFHQLMWMGMLCTVTGRFEEALNDSRRIVATNPNPFFTSAAYALRMYVDVKRADFGAIPALVREAESAGARKGSCDMFLALAAAIEGRTGEARNLLDASIARTDLAFATLYTAADCAIRLGDLSLAARLMSRGVAESHAHVTIRVDPDLIALADTKEFAPRRFEAPIVWPLEAPMIDTTRFQLFRGMRVESGLPER